MRQFTQFRVAARRRVAFQGMDGAPHLAQYFFIFRTLLQLQPLFIECLQQFCCALKEEFAKLGGVIVREEIHPATSMRWYAVPLFWCSILYLSERPNRLSACPMNRYPSAFRQR